MRNAAIRIVAIVSAWVLLIPGVASSNPIGTPYARREPLQIRQVLLPDSAPVQYGCLEITVDLGATYDNPFDPSDIAVDACLSLPNGESQEVPGFFYRPFERTERQGQEVLAPSGKPGWRVRLAPPVAGDYSVAITVRDRTGRRESAPVRFTVRASGDPGFVRVSPRDRRYFEFDNHRSFYPIGLNLCWPSEARGTLDYDAWIPAFTKAGCNATRLWLAPAFTPLALERVGKREDGHGMGQFDLAAAWRLDYVLKLAQREGMYVKICIDSFNELRKEPEYPYWDKTPQNAANGGPLERPGDFWTNPAMDRLYRNKLRYLVARFGAFSHVLSWEFWNEVDIISEYQTGRVRDWHERMAQHLREIDPYGHLITTSFARSEGDPAIDKLAVLDYVQTHRYGGADPVAELDRYQREKARLGKPHYVGEFGADAGGDRFASDPEGVQIHDPLWMTAATGGSGTAQPWYWELIHARGMHGLFRSVAEFTAGIDWPGEQARRIEPRLAWKTPPVPLPRKDVLLPTTTPSWERSEYNQPRTVRIDQAGVRGQLPLAGIQHGIGGHKDKHNPVRLEIDLGWPTRFCVDVRGVSGWGGAALAIRVDGRRAIARDFSNTNAAGDHETLNQYNGSYEVALPAGRHVVEVENGGPDWFYSSYRLRDGAQCNTPPLLAWATAGQSNVLAWVRLEGRSWTRVCVLRESLPACPPSELILPQLTPGHWIGELWDTWTGKMTSQVAVDVPANGEAKLELPEIAKDIAVRLKRAR